jgi:hypothetical protein
MISSTSNIGTSPVLINFNKAKAIAGAVFFPSGSRIIPLVFCVDFTQLFHSQETIFFIANDKWLRYIFE